MELTKTHLKYLLALYRLSQKRPDLPSMEVARLLGVSKPSVVRMLEVLMEQGLAVKARYGKIYLTDTGFLMAKRLSAPLERYAAQLQQEFSLSDDEAWNAACAAICSGTFAPLPPNRFSWLLSSSRYFFFSGTPT